MLGRNLMIYNKMRNKHFFNGILMQLNRKNLKKNAPKPIFKNKTSNFQDR